MGNTNGNINSENKHHHHHSHIENNKLRGKKLLTVTLINFSITVFQFIGGIFSNSLSLISDAVHNLGDSSALFIAFLAGKRSQKEANKTNTFGYKRTEILAALFNAVVLIGICIYLFFEAYNRFLHPEQIKGNIMLIVAIFGLLANVISVIVLHKDKTHNLNIKAAYMHLLGDTLSSIAVILGGIAIWIWHLYWIDPLITILVSIYIAYHTFSIVKETTNILMQATPDGIEIMSIKKDIEALENIDNIHHLHIWQLFENQIHFEAHIAINQNLNLSQIDIIRNNIEKILLEKYQINHSTLQFGYKCCKENESLLHTHS